MAENTSLLMSCLLTLLTLLVYQLASKFQQRYQHVWLNPMLLAIIVLIPLLLYHSISFQSYQQATALLSYFLEPAIVALGFPLYQQLKPIRFHWRPIIALLAFGVVIVILVSFSLTMLWVAQADIAIALSLKSVTTPIGITLTEQLNGDSSITAFAIIIAGFFGGILGPKWLSLLGITHPRAQGLAIGAASHVIGTAIVAKISNEQAAYSAIALIFSALLTALISPFLLPYLISHIN